MATPTKISVYSVPELKNTTDDALPNYLSSLKFTQSHYHSDVRLALGYAAVIISGLTFYFDWTLGWDKTKYWTAWAVAAYFILNGAFTYWIWGVEKGTVYSGEKDGAKLIISTSSEKHIPLYNLTVRYSLPSKSSTPFWQTLELKAPFTRWFTADGFFVAKPFQQWLASEIPLIGEADPTNVVEEIGRGSEATQGTNLGSVKPGEVQGVLNQLRGTGGGTAKKRRG